MRAMDVRVFGSPSTVSPGRRQHGTCIVWVFVFNEDMKRLLPPSRPREDQPQEEDGAKSRKRRSNRSYRRRIQESAQERSLFLTVVTERTLRLSQLTGRQFRILSSEPLVLHVRMNAWRCVSSCVAVVMPVQSILK